MTLDQVWSNIRAKGNQSPFPLFSEFRGILLTKPQKSHFGRTLSRLIGPYLEVRQIARSLPSDKALQETLTTLNVRVGRRETDDPPQVLRKGRDPGIGDWGPAKATDVGDLLRRRKNPNNPGRPTARVSDLYDPVRTYWTARTLEAHHIVEKRILTDLRLNKLDLDNNRAPTVLLAAEFHQRLFTSEVASERQVFNARMTGAEAYKSLKRIYEELYADEVLLALKEIAEIINSAVKHDLY